MSKTVVMKRDIRIRPGCAVRMSDQLKKIVATTNEEQFSNCVGIVTPKYGLETNAEVRWEPSGKTTTWAKSLLVLETDAPLKLDSREDCLEQLESSINLIDYINDTDGSCSLTAALKTAGHWASLIRISIACLRSRQQAA